MSSPFPERFGVSSDLLLSAPQRKVDSSRKTRMVNSTVHTFSVLFAIISGTGAGLLALLSWRAFRDSPFGTVIALLSVTMSGMILYHVVLFPFAANTLFLDTLRSVLQTIVAIFLWLMVVTHQQIEYAATGG